MKLDVNTLDTETAEAVRAGIDSRQTIYGHDMYRAEVVEALIRLFGETFAFSEWDDGTCIDMPTTVCGEPVLPDDDVRCVLYSSSSGRRFTLYPDGMCGLDSSGRVVQYDLDVLLSTTTLVEVA